MTQTLTMKWRRSLCLNASKNLLLILWKSCYRDRTWAFPLVPSTPQTNSQNHFGTAQTVTATTRREGWSCSGPCMNCQGMWEDSVYVGTTANTRRKIKFSYLWMQPVMKFGPCCKGNLMIMRLVIFILGVNLHQMVLANICLRGWLTMSACVWASELIKPES